MKAFKFFAMLFAAFALCFTATSCGDDDVEDIIENGKAKTELKESKDQIVLTINYPGYKSVTTAKFSNELCNSYITVMTYSTDKLADIAWEEYKKDVDDSGASVWKRDGKTISADLTNEVQGMPYEFILSMMKRQKDAIDNAASNM